MLKYDSYKIKFVILTSTAFNKGNSNRSFMGTSLNIQKHVFLYEDITDPLLVEQAAVTFSVSNDIYIYIYFFKWLYLYLSLFQ